MATNEPIFDRDELKEELKRILFFYDSEVERLEEAAETRGEKYEDALKELYESVRKFFEYGEKPEEKEKLHYLYFVIRDKYESGDL